MLVHTIGIQKSRSLGGCFLDTMHDLGKNFYFRAMAPSPVEDSVFCIPHLIRGHSGHAFTN